MGSSTLERPVAGDLVFRLETERTSRWKRDGADVLMSVNITLDVGAVLWLLRSYLQEAVTGFQRELTSFDGSSLTVVKKGVTFIGEC